MPGRRDPLEAIAERWGAAGYLVVILGTEVLTKLVGYLAWERTGPGAGAQFVVYIVGVALGLLLWRQCPRRAPAAGLLRAVLALAAVLWLLEIGRRVVVGEPFNPLWVTVPLLLAMTWWKPPSAPEARSTITAVAVVFSVAVVVAVACEAAGWSRSWYDLLSREAQQEGDASNYWLPLAGLIGLDARWAGPFIHPNHAGPIGGLLVVVGMSRRGTVQWWLLAVGFLVLLLTSSRTALVGALAGACAILLAAALWDRRITWPQWVVMSGTTVALLVTLAWSVRYSGQVASTSAAEQVASASGRSTIWPVYAQIWQESPWWGVPDDRIVLAVEAGRLPDWAATAHNLLLDSLVRFGIVGAALVVAVLAVTGVMAVRAAAARSRVGLGLVFVILGCALTEAVVFWRTWAVSTIILFLAVIASAGSYPPARWPRRASKAPEPITSTAD